MDTTDYLAWIVVRTSIWGLMLLAAAGPGHLVARRFRFHSFLERLVFTLGLGLGVWGLALFVLGLVGVLYRQLIVALTVISATGMLIYLMYGLVKGPRPDFRQWKTRIFRARTLLVAPVVLILLCYWLILLLSTQYPPINWDSTSNHLVLVKEYLAQHRVVAHEGMVFPVLPALNHLLFTWGMALKDDIMAQVIEHTLMMLTAAALYAWGIRLNRRAFGLAAATFWLGHPLVIFLGESAYVDIGFTYYVFLGIYALRLFWDERQSEWWYLGLALLAMSAGVKLPGLLFIGLGSALGLWACLKSTLSWQQLVRGGVLALLIAAPWYGFVAAHSGNPFWPALASFSQGDSWRTSAEMILTMWSPAGLPKTPLNFLLLPIHVVLNPDPFFPDYHRQLLPLVIAFPLAWVISIFNRSVRWWTLWALAYLLFWFVTSQQLRFWVAILPLIGLALYESLQWIMERITQRTVVHTLIWLALTLFAIQSNARLNLEIQIARGMPPVTPEARESFLTRLYSGYNAVKYINERAGAGEAVYTMNGSWLNYYFKPKVIDASGALQMLNRPKFRLPQDEPWLRYLDDKNVKWIFMIYRDAPEVVIIPQQNPAKNPFWSDYALVYFDSYTWVFRRKPIPPENL